MTREEAENLLDEFLEKDETMTEYVRRDDHIVWTPAAEYNAVSEYTQLREKLIEILEQKPILDKIEAEIVDTLYVDSLIFGELIDFKNGKIDADDVIEEFNRVTRSEVLQIIDKYRAESENRNADSN